MSHTTETEIAFLDKIGAFNKEHKNTKAEVLRGYVGGSAKRVKWGGVDKKKVVAHAVKLLSAEMAADAILNDSMAMTII